MSKYPKFDGLFIILAYCISTFCSLEAYAQDDDLNRVSGTYAIKNVTIIPSPGQKIENGVIVIKDGIISGVGKEVDIPSNAIIIKADSMFAYAGFIDGFSHIGVSPVSDEKKEKVKHPGNPPPERAGITPDRDVRDFINTKDNSIADYRGQGFTIAQVVPSGNLLPGQAAIILLSGNSTDEMVMVARSSLYSELSGASSVYPATIMGVMAKWRELHKQASQAKIYETNYYANPTGLERPESSRILQAFYPVIDGKTPVLFKSEKVIETQRVLTLQKDLGFKLIIGDLKEGWPIISKLKNSGASIFLSLDLPEEIGEKKDSTASEEKLRLEKRKKETIANYVSQAVEMTKAGVVFGFSTNSVKAKSIHENLRRMVSAGLSEDVALASLTTNAAKILGISDRVGTIEKGKIANLILTDRPYFQEKTEVQQVFVDGKLYTPSTGTKNANGKKASVEGQWSYTADTPQGKGGGKLVIENSSGRFKGSITNNFSGQETRIEEFDLSGNRMAFNYTIDIGGNQLKIEVSVAIDGDTFEGNMTAGQYGTFPMTGVRQPKSLMISENN
ncbi:MAG: amidohydrolase family protein [Cyclobacteriaceae bacterium]